MEEIRINLIEFMEVEQKILKNLANLIIPQDEGKRMLKQIYTEYKIYYKCLDDISKYDIKKLNEKQKKLFYIMKSDLSDGIDKLKLLN